MPPRIISFAQGFLSKYIFLERNHEFLTLDFRIEKKYRPLRFLGFRNLDDSWTDTHHATEYFIEFAAIVLPKKGPHNPTLSVIYLL